MSKWILRNILFTCLLTVTSSQLLAETEHFWLLQEYGIEKRAMSDGALIKSFASLTKPLAFSIKPQQQGIWAIADGFLVSFDGEGNSNSINSVPLENINQNAYLVSMPETGVWLFHGDKRYTVNSGSKCTRSYTVKHFKRCLIIEALSRSMIQQINYSIKL
jgi:hypothetical protein